MDKLMKLSALSSVLWYSIISMNESLKDKYNIVEVTGGKYESFKN